MKPPVSLVHARTCGGRTFTSLLFTGGKGVHEAAENRNYLAGRMVDEINEIIRVLQLTTYDEDEWDADNLTVMKKAMVGENHTFTRRGGGGGCRVSISTCHLGLVPMAEGAKSYGNFQPWTPSLTPYLHQKKRKTAFLGANVFFWKIVGSKFEDGDVLMVLGVTS